MNASRVRNEGVICLGRTGGLTEVVHSIEGKLKSPQMMNGYLVERTFAAYHRILHQRSWTRTWKINTENIEQRRVIIEVVGTTGICCFTAA